jgi:hypothetical protein
MGAAMATSFSRFWWSFVMRVALAAWFTALAVCLFARGAEAQPVSASWPLVDSVGWALDTPSEPRWRDDDPDLMRAGEFDTPQGTLAEGAHVRRFAVVDLDGDRFDERLYEVFPREDPAPQNPWPGLVLVRSDGRGWRAQVLGRVAWENEAVSRAYYSFTWSDFNWDLVREGGRTRLVLYHRLSVSEENPTGRGQLSWPHEELLRIALVDGAPQIDGFCVRHGDPGRRVWRGVTPVCMCTETNADAATPCDACGATLLRYSPEMAEFDETRESAPPPWCQRFVAEHRFGAARR